METRYCPGCRAERVVEQPPCLDGHEDCPEWACTECGLAIVFGWLDLDNRRAAALGDTAKVRRRSA
jgi:hypothetical protein